MITSFSPGTRLGRYKVHSLLGAGLAEVFLAYDTLLYRNVALKILPVDLFGKRQQLNRFEQEARAGSALNHPNIITIHEIGVEGNIHFIATEFIEGETLRLKLQARLEIKETLEIATQIAAALEAAHQRGIVHRDIKPENVMVRTDGLVKVLDFGLAKLTEKTDDVPIDSHADTRPLVKTTPGTVVGTIAYMSPEQARGLEVDARTDIFSLGVVLYEMLTGSRPFEGATVSDVLAAILKSEPAPLGDNAPAELQRIVKKTLQKDVNERYQTSKDLLIDLKSIRHDLDFSVELERSGIPRKAEQSASPQDQSFHPSPWVEKIARGVRRHKRFIAVALALLVIGAIAYLIWRGRPLAPVATQIKSIAVLPLQNATGDANLDYLSDGVSESLLDKLSQLPQIKVIARSSSFKYRGENIDIQDVANKLGVQAIIMGRVMRRGDDLTIRVEVIDVHENKQLWGEEYTRKVADTLPVQQEIAQTISEKLRLKLTGAQEKQLAKRPTENPEAYQLYLTGLFVSRTNLKNSLDYFTQATILDPNFAVAFYRLSWCYFYLGYNSEVDPKETSPKARALLQRALQIDDSLAEAHSLMAAIKQSEWDWAGAENEITRVLELNPNTAVAHQLNANRLAKAGRIEEAVTESRLAQSLDPLEIPPKIQEGGIYYFARRFDEAIARFQQIVKLAPDSALAHGWLGYAYAAKGMYREAIMEYQQRTNRDGDSTSDQCYLGYALAKSEKRNEALALLNKLKTTKDYVSLAELAILYIGLGDKEKAFESLEKAYVAHDLQLQNLRADPHYDDLHADQRFQDLLRRIGV